MESIKSKIITFYAIFIAIVLCMCLGGLTSSAAELPNENIISYSNTSYTPNNSSLLDIWEYDYDDYYNNFKTYSFSIYENLYEDCIDASITLYPSYNGIYYQYCFFGYNVVFSSIGFEEDIFILDGHWFLYYQDFRFSFNAYTIDYSDYESTNNFYDLYADCEFYFYNQDYDLQWFYLDDCLYGDVFYGALGNSAVFQDNVSCFYSTGYDFDVSNSHFYDCSFDTLAYTIHNSLLDFKNIYNQGLENSYNNGYDVGFDDGVDSGYEDGYSQGFFTGEEVGLEQGYNNGYQVGSNDGYTNGFTEGSDAVIDAYINFYTFSFDNLQELTLAYASDEGFITDSYSSNGLILFKSDFEKNRCTFDKMVEEISYLVDDNGAPYYETVDTFYSFVFKNAFPSSQLNLDFTGFYKVVLNDINGISYTFNVNHDFIQDVNTLDLPNENFMIKSITFFAIGDFSDAGFDNYLDNHGLSFNNDALSSYQEGYNAGVISQASEIRGLKQTIKNLEDRLNNYVNNDFTLSNLFWSIGSIPFESFKQIWNVDFLGVNLGGFMTGFFVVLIAVFIIKKFLK